MFTGIITDIGHIRKITANGTTRFDIETNYATEGIAIGASIACAGVCLTVIETGADWFAVEASQETLNITTLGRWQQGTRLNLERALCAGDELGGHIVSGHIDAVAMITTIAPEGDSQCFTFTAPSRVMRFIAPKGSITLDGVSLTINHVEGHQFTVMVIPHTQAVTTFGAAQTGDAVNLEIDMLARYVARLQDYEGA